METQRLSPKEDTPVKHARAFFKPSDFFARLQALIPPRFNQKIYFGILAAAHVLTQIKKQNPNKKGGADTAEPKLAKDSSWARLLAKTFKIDVAACPICKADLKITAALQDKDEIHKFLREQDLGKPIYRKRYPSIGMQTIHPDGCNLIQIKTESIYQRIKLLADLTPLETYGLTH